MAELRPEQQSLLQPDHDDCIQDFLSWKKSPETYRKGCGGPNNDINRNYISWKTLKDKLSKERIDQLLEALFRSWDKPKPDAEKIRKHYLRPFAILLCIGQGHMIEQFQKQPGLEDRYLPFRREPPGFPVLSKGEDFYLAFHREQWAFCAMKLTYLIDSDLKKDDILPITDKNKIDEGGSAITYKVIVDEDYDELVPVPSDHEHLDPSRHIYVVKTYRSRKAQTYYNTEREAFLQLRFHGEPPLNIIGFYGSFLREDTYNIILEYADLGNLEEFMSNNPPPSSADERLMFWDRFLDVANGLVIIHGQSERNASLPILSGWHQDVHPANILVQSRKEARSPYDCHYKLADLGLTHFKKHVHRDATDQDSFGTGAYGAPETRSPDPKIEQWKLRFKQDADIWSLGCVFSEVATWVDQGWTKVLEYRRHRSDEVEEKTGTREDCFDDGLTDLLDSVKEIHREILQSRRVNDHVTPNVISQLVQEMLLVKDPRPDANYLYRKSRRMIRDAYVRKDNTSDGTPSDPRKQRLKMPPNLPFDHPLRDSAELFGDQMSYPVWVPRTPKSPPFPEVEDQDTGRYSGSVQTSPSNAQDRRTSYRRGTSDVAPFTPSDGQGATNRNSRQTHWGNTHGYFPTLQNQGVYPTSINANDHLVGSPHNSTLDIDQSYENDTGGWTGPSRRRNTGRFAPQDSTKSAARTAEENVLPASASKRISASTTSKDHIPTATENNLQHVDRTASVSASPRVEGKNHRPLPEMSVERGLELKKTREFAKYAPFPHHQLFKSLSKRDHAFFVDNSESMAEHRPQVCRVLELLSYMVAPSDPDGLDVYFSTDDENLKPKNHYQILKELDSRPAQGIPDFRQRFANILEEYQSKFGKRNFFSKIRQMPSKGPRKLSLYVLTDAVWQPNTDLEVEIKTLVQNLLDNKLTNKHIGIQFIRFGRYPTGMARLRRLDSELGLGLDIVDTTPANGNVWKMLLGSINDWFDGDLNDRDDDGEGWNEGRNNHIAPAGTGNTRSLH